VWKYKKERFPKCTVLRQNIIPRHLPRRARRWSGAETAIAESSSAGGSVSASATRVSIVSSQPMSSSCRIGPADSASKVPLSDGGSSEGRDSGLLGAGWRNSCSVRQAARAHVAKWMAGVRDLSAITVRRICFEIQRERIDSTWGQSR
jgi:hypothetical protein